MDNDTEIQALRGALRTTTDERDAAKALLLDASARYRAALADQYTQPGDLIDILDDLVDKADQLFPR
jgi:hypothetical protein